MIETVFSAELPVREHLLIQKNRIVGAEFANATPEELEAAPRLAVVTGIHGDELEGQYVAFELAQRLNANLDQLHGIVDIYPAINPLGINSIQRGIPMFDLDLNRVFPGNPEGPLAETLAAAVYEDISGATCAVDIHASNIFLREMPQVRINEESADVLVPLAKLVNADFIWVHANATVLASTLAYSLNSTGTPCLVIEAGVGMRLTYEYGHNMTEGMLRLASELGIWSGDFECCEDPIVSGDHKVSFLNATAAGVFMPTAEHGTHVAEGDIIGRIVDPLEGKVCDVVTSPVDGLLFTLREYPVVYPGSLLARILGDETCEA